ncbi:hypothetical protein D3C87_1586670 [compost metagenome]
MAFSKIDPHPLKILIVDYATSEEQKDIFINQVNSVLGLSGSSIGQFTKNDPRISFEGVNSVLHYY